MAIAVARAKESAQFEAQLANASPELRELKQLHRSENWRAEAGDSRMVEGLNKFAEKHDQLPEDCLAWLRDFIESVNGYKGVWNAPDAMKGKKKDKPVYKSVRIRDLVKRLRDLT